MRTFTCGQCHFECSHGVHVCRGCSGDVVYGATMDERKQGAMLGGVAGLVIGFGPVNWVIAKLSSLIGTQPGQLSLVAVLACGGIGALAGMYLTHRVYAKHIRTFRSRRVS
jgi:hypothetical protein